MHAETSSLTAIFLQNTLHFENRGVPTQAERQGVRNQTLLYALMKETDHVCPTKICTEHQLEIF